MSAEVRRQVPAVSWHQVQLTGGMWKQRQDVNRRVTLPVELHQLRNTGRIDAIRLQWKKGDPVEPHVFWDSDVAKWLEAASYSLAHHPDAQLAAAVKEVVDLYARAQGPDGYINSHFRAVRPEQRWTNLRSLHELYTAGHLFEAAAAHYHGSAQRDLLDTMCRFADHIDATFGRGKGKKRGYPGHQEIELALVKLYRATGTKRYLRLAAYFINQRGQRPLYFHQEARAAGDPRADRWKADGEAAKAEQAHCPVREQQDLVGHSVRALYMLAGMVDVAAETGDASLWQACQRLWRSGTQRRMYLTGGVGSTAHYEQFTFDYDLPNETAYAETCAAIALVFVAQRMAEVEPDRAYTDVMERALYNGVLSGVSLSGDRFFYSNPLRAHPQRATFDGRSDHRAVTRQQWFGCACCPPNIARLLASIGGYLYATHDDTLYVHLYADSSVTTRVAGSDVLLRQTTDYPWQETVTLEVDPGAPRRFALALRIPGWCQGAVLKVNGQPAVLGRLDRGYALIRRRWQAGDLVELTLPMPVRRTYAHPACRANLGMVALERGPVVYCLEETDNGPDLHGVSLPHDAALTARHDPTLLGGVTVISGNARRLKAPSAAHPLYGPTAARKSSRHRLVAVPYAVWNNRGSGEMTVWLREG